MQKHVLGLCLAISLLSVAGCQYFQFPGVYKIDVQQGNIVTQEMVDQLKPGMTRRQVRFIMGTPLIEDTFSPNRWDYLYSMVPAKGEPTRERISIYFDGDTLSHFSGDYIPASARTSGDAPDTSNSSNDNDY